MKIVDLKTFRAMPEGTLYSKYRPAYCDGLMIKGETWEYDFLYQDLIGNLKAESSEIEAEQYDKAEAGESVPLDFNVQGRDGLFEKDQLFAVYEKDDLAGLIARLQDCV